LYWEYLVLSASVTLKSAVFAPIPSAKDDTATAEKPGLRINSRTPERKSVQNFSPIPRSWCPLACGAGDSRPEYYDEKRSYNIRTP